MRTGIEPVINRRIELEVVRIWKADDASLKQPVPSKHGGAVFDGNGPKICKWQKQRLQRTKDQSCSPLVPRLNQKW